MKLNSLISFLPMHSMLIKSNNQYGCSIVNNGIRRLSCSRKADDSFQGWGWWAGGWKETKNDAERQKMELLLMQFLDFQLSVLCLFFFDFHNVSKKKISLIKFVSVRGDDCYTSVLKRTFLKQGSETCWGDMWKGTFLNVSTLKKPSCHSYFLWSYWQNSCCCFCDQDLAAEVSLWTCTKLFTEFRVVWPASFPHCHTKSLFQNFSGHLAFLLLPVKSQKYSVYPCLYWLQ